MAIFDKAFSAITSPQAEKFFILIRTQQPERRLTFLQYRNTRIDAFRIKMGRYEYQKHRQLLNWMSEKICGRRIQ
ncbi:hypothetical protein [Candidatus Coxiella mudrowiae]|uniref:hypothetical protein n=1 Tax=Candidatus Coxiella mudrowiae TaxID=2054173 RepID=UPI0031453417